MRLVAWAWVFSIFFIGILTAHSLFLICLRVLHLDLISSFGVVGAYVLFLPARLIILIYRSEQKVLNDAQNGLLQDYEQ